MSRDGNPVRPDSLATRVAQRNDLDRDQLLALVEDLHRLVVDQRKTVERQRGAIEQLQSRNGGEPAPAAPLPAPQPAQPARAPRATARTVPGTDYTIVFDGGALGNPGKGYGSYQIVGAGGIVAEQSLKYGDNVTNNQAEFMTIARALDDLRERLGQEAPRSRVAIRGDSQLVINTITGRWKARHPGLIPLHLEVVGLLRAFGKTDIRWQPRSESVAILGH